MRLILAAAVIAAAPMAAPAQQQVGAAADDWSAVEQALGRRGAAQPGGVMRVSFPRRDLDVTAAGVRLRPAFALGSWVAFKRVGGGRGLRAALDRTNSAR